jgi:hypothetical protein
MSQRLPAVLSCLDLPQVELMAARLDGELYGIGECFSPIDVNEQPAHRAGSLAALLPDRLIAEQHTAAWVLGVRGSPPARHQLCADTTARIRSSGLVLATVREVVLERTDVFECGGLRVTTALRTAVDIARVSPTFSAFDANIVSRLMLLGEFGLDECRGMLDRRRNLPGKRLALERLAQAIAAGPD